MVYKYTIDNILSLLQTVGTLTKEQIMRFFSGELADYRVEYLLDQLEIKHILKYDGEADTFSFVGAAHYQKETQAKLIRAFWILVAAGSNNVQEIILTRFPTQFLFITPAGDTYDVTVVESEHDALLAQRVFGSEYRVDEPRQSCAALCASAWVFGQRRTNRAHAHCR